MMRPTCQFCLFWEGDRQAADRGGQYSSGQCRRYPPVKRDYCTGWPSTRYSEWCGEFVDIFIPTAEAIAAARAHVESNYCSHCGSQISAGYLHDTNCPLRPAPNQQQQGDARDEFRPYDEMFSGSFRNKKAGL